MEPNAKIFTKDEILAEIAAVNAEITALFSEITVENMFGKPGDKWSAAENLEHLIKSVTPLAKGLRMPKAALALTFGKAKRASRTFEEMVSTYKAELGKGAKATRPFIPELKNSNPGGEVKEDLMTSWESAVEGLQKTIAKWKETDLDVYRMPHPVLGKLTVREMLFFTVYHNFHHKKAVELIV